MPVRQFVDTVARLKFPNTFNPYSSCCPVHDYSDAPHLRFKTLRLMLDAATQVHLDAIWIGRDLGYRGGRRTGLALTDDMHIQAHAARWGISAVRPTKGQAVAE